MSLPLTGRLAKTASTMRVPAHEIERAVTKALRDHISDSGADERSGLLGNSTQAECVYLFRALLSGYLCVSAGPPLKVQEDHADECLLLGVKRTSHFLDRMSAFDPKPTWDRL